MGYFADYLRLVGIRHIITSPYHPQPNGKMERNHRTVKGELSLIPCQIPNELERAISSFIQYYNYGRYHEGLGNVTPYDVYTGRHMEVLQSRKEAKSRTLEARKGYNKAATSQSSGL